MIAHRRDELWAWRGFELELPPDWEMLQFSHDAARGRCAFADRRRFRLEMNWRQTGGAPDTVRMIGDYEARLLELGMKKHDRLNMAGWSGLEGEMDGIITTRLGRYFAAQDCLVELVLLRDGHGDRTLERTIVESFREAPAVAPPRARWRAFGLDVSLPAGFAVAECSIQPACAEMRFVKSARTSEARCARRGMVGEWLRTPVREWLAAWVGPRVRIDQVSDSPRAQGHEGAVLRGRARGRWAQSAPFVAQAWICPNDGRLYGVSSLGRATDGLEFACCEHARGTFQA